MHGFARFAHASPRLFDRFGKPQPAQCLFSLDQAIPPQCDQPLFCAKTGPTAGAERPGCALKNHFQRLVEGPASAPGSRPAASRRPAPSRQRPAALPLPCGAGSASFSKGLPALRAADGHGVHGPRVEAPRRVRRRSEGARVR